MLRTSRSQLSSKEDGFVDVSQQTEIEFECRSGSSLSKPLMSVNIHSETPPGENQNLFVRLTVRTYVYFHEWSGTVLNNEEDASVARQVYQRLECKWCIKDSNAIGALAYHGRFMYACAFVSVPIRPHVWLVTARSSNNLISKMDTEVLDVYLSDLNSNFINELMCACFFRITTNVSILQTFLSASLPLSPYTSLCLFVKSNSQLHIRMKHLELAPP